MTRLRTIACITAGALACGPHTSGSTDSDTGTGSSTGASGTSTGDTDTGLTGVPVPECTAGAGEPDGTLKWSLAGDELSAFVGAMALRPTGELVLAGTKALSDLDPDVVVEVRDVDGAVKWQDVYGGAQGLSDRALGVAVDAEGFIHVLLVETILGVIAETGSTSDARLVVLRYAPDGAHEWRWEREHAPVEPWNDYFPAGQLGLAGDTLLVLEHAFAEPTVLLGLDRFGNVTSEVALAVPSGLDIDRHDLAPDGSVFISGHIEPQGGQHALWIGRFAGDGTLTWSDQFGGLDDRATTVIAGRDGDVFLAWSTSLPADSEHRLRHYDPAGAEAWTELLPVVGREGGVFDGAIRCDGVLLLTGGAERPPHPDSQWGLQKNLWVAGYTVDGDPLWALERPFGSPDSFGDGGRIAAAYDGDAIVAGSFLDDSGSTYLPWLGRFAGG